MPFVNSKGADQTARTCMQSDQHYCYSQPKLYNSYTFLNQILRNLASLCDLSRLVRVLPGNKAHNNIEQMKAQTI